MMRPPAIGGGLGLLQEVLQSSGNIHTAKIMREVCKGLSGFVVRTTTVSRRPTVLLLVQAVSLEAVAAQVVPWDVQVKQVVRGQVVRGVVLVAGARSYVVRQSSTLEACKLRRIRTSLTGSKSVVAGRFAFCWPEKEN